ncbi:MAG: hypothetical protein FWE55_03950 [Synergistaceae bacterium]|nr:hypothetical protein [Synergistaceae bacterium]
MAGFREILRDGDFRRPGFLCAAALVVWILLITLIFSSDTSLNLARADLSSSGRVIDYAMQLKALPRTRNVITDIPEEPLSVLSNIINALGLRNRMQQLQSNPSGIVVQLERLYGNELGELLGSIENNGMFIKTAEIKALPGEGGRLLSVVLTMEAAK